VTAIVHTAEKLQDRPDLIRRRVTGTPAEVEATLGMVRAQGHLVAATMPAVVHGDRHRVTTLVTLRVVPLSPIVPAAAPRPVRRWVKPVSIAGGIVTSLAGLGWLLYVLIGATVHAAAAASPVALFVLAVLVIGPVLLLRRKSGSSCSGIHCGGCKGGH
jgi:hypothetical protein